MKTNLKLLFALILFSNLAVAQSKFFTRNGTISFFSKTPMENIEAVNNQSSSVFDTEKGEIAVSAQMKGFEFEKALMQEHFNENYVESEKYPTATFKGSIKNYNKSAFKVNEENLVDIEGDLTLHGVTKHISTTAKITWSEGKIAASSEFSVAVADFNIKVPSAVIGNIADSILVKAVFNLEPYTK